MVNMIIVFLIGWIFISSKSQVSPCFSPSSVPAIAVMLKAIFRWASDIWERVLEFPKFAYANERKETITLQKLGS